MKGNWLSRIFKFSVLAVLMALVANMGLPATSAAKGGGDPGLVYKDKVTLDDKVEASKRFWESYYNSLVTPSGVIQMDAIASALDPLGVPHYFGPYPNWAYSKLPRGAVADIALTAGGNGYAAPAVAIIDLYGTGSGATATATVSGGQITGITLTSGGTDYTAPQVVITDAGGGSGATATATIGGALSGGIRKFVDSLPTLGPGGANGLGQYLPVAVADTTTYPGSDYYEIGLVEFQEQMHSDLPPTIMRGYVQLSTAVVPGAQVALMNPDGTPILMPDGSQAYGVDYAHYLGPTIVTERDRPVRVKFTNLLPIGVGGDLFIPTDTTLMGAGMGPVMDMGTGQPIDYTQNRAAVHLHGNNTVWISDGTPFQWITPANENTPYPKGVSVFNVPDMPDPGDGSVTIFYTNAQSARLMFYHDHAVGITRLNVYAGEAAGYVITDPVDQDMINGTNNSGVNPDLLQVLPDIGIPLVIQDRTWVDPDTIAYTDPTWGWSLDELGNPIAGALWYPHVYMPAQNPYDPSGANPFARWHYAAWFWPPATDLTYPPIPNPYYDPVNAPWEPPYMPATPNPSAVGEAFMDTPTVNGTAYPYLEVEPRAYRFRILNAANDRFFNLSWFVADPAVITSDGRANTEVKMVPATATPGWPGDWPTDGREGGAPDPAAIGPDWIQIGTEGGFLPAPAVIPAQPTTYVLDPTLFNVGNVDKTSLLLGSAERADVIVDFSAYAGKTLILYNDAPAAFPALDVHYDYYTDCPDRTDIGGAPPTHAGFGPNTRTVMQVRVGGVSGTQTRLVTSAPNVVNPGDTINLSATVNQLPGNTPVATAGLPVDFNYVLYLLETGTTQTGSATVNTDATGTAAFSLVAPMEKTVVLVDAVFNGSGAWSASSNMNIISVVPIIEARITASSTLGSILFHLADQYGNPLPNQALSFLTTGGVLSTAGGTTNAGGDVAVTLSGVPSAVVSASFGGYIDARGWAYQPTQARTTVETALSSNIQTRVVTTAPNIVSPGDTVSIIAEVFRLPGLTKEVAAGLPVTFNYVAFLLETGTSTPGTATVSTDASGNATLSLAAPNESSVILVDAVFTGSGSLYPSSNMKIVSTIVIIEARITAAATGGDVTFNLTDQYGDPIAGQTLTFLTTSGILSAASGVTDASGNITVNVSGTASAVVSASFGGYIDARGWAYQPTQHRIQVDISPVSPAPPYDLAALEGVFAKTAAKSGVFEVSQDKIIIPSAEYNSAYDMIFPTEQMVRQDETSKIFQTVDGATVTIPLQPKAIQDEMGEAYDTEYGRMSGMLGLELPFTAAGNQNFILYGFLAPPVDIITGSVSGTQIGSLDDGTQIWRITHNGVDTHPIHVHLFNAQLINRIAWDGAILPPAPNELGWKETIRVNPLEHTIIALRPEYLSSLPFDVPNSVRLIDPTRPPGDLLITPPGGFFDPLGNDITVTNHYVNFGWEYVYHCHILAHEEMDMMHATIFAVPPAAPSNLAAAVLSGPSRVSLTWQDDSLNETNWLVRRASSGAGPWTTIATLTTTTGPEAGVTIEYTDSPLTPGATYYYQVVAANIVGDTTLPNFPTVTRESAPSGTVSAAIP